MTTAARAALTLLFTLLTAIAVQAEPAWKTTNIGGIHYAVERSALHPKAWRQELQHTYDCQDPCIVEFDDRISAVFLRYKWAQLNPAKGVYDFSDLGEVLDLIHGAGKMATLQVMGGKYTPAWVFEEGAGHIATRAKTGDKFSQPLVPRLWDPVYLAEYGAMLTALSDFLRETPTRYQTVVMVKNGAVVIHSGETRMMPVDAFDIEIEVDKKSRKSKAEFYKSLCDDWARAGYSEGKILQSIQTSNAQIAAAFPDQYIGLAYVGGSDRFPTVNDAGACTYPAKNKTVRRIIEDVVNAYGARAMINNTVLTPDMGNPPVMIWTRKNGGQIGFQIERRRVGCRVEKGNVCDDTLFAKTLQAGVDAGAVFIEVHDGNIEVFKDTLAKYNAILENR